MKLPRIHFAENSVSGVQAEIGDVIVETGIPLFAIPFDLGQLRHRADYACGRGEQRWIGRSRRVTLILATKAHYFAIEQGTARSTLRGAFNNPRPVFGFCAQAGHDRILPNIIHLSRELFATFVIAQPVVGREVGAQLFEAEGVAVAAGGVAVHGVWVALFCGVVCDAA